MATSSVSKREVTVTLALEEKEALDLLELFKDTSARHRIVYQKFYTPEVVQVHSALYTALNKAGLVA